MQAEHLEVVGAAEIVEGVVGGDEDALFGGHAGGLFGHVGVQCRQFGQIGGGVGFEGAEADLGVGLDQVTGAQMVVDGRLDVYKRQPPTPC